MSASATQDGHNKKAVLSQGTTARCVALVQKACTESSGKAVEKDH